MGRSAKFNRVGKTKKERDAIKITMNSRISKKPASGPNAATRKPAIASSIAVPTAANKLAARKDGANGSGAGKQPVNNTAMSGVSSDKEQPPKEHKHILSGRVDYVSLMNSRRSAKALKELKEMKP
ncbi:hypothetical protein HDU86_000672 [Geranomyces michiganensis]|nr:hypothetical protein HDU86_000672 [Geranomyces michiganensis]